jgi:hypothetical protein
MTSLLRGLSSATENISVFLFCMKKFSSPFSLILPAGLFFFVLAFVFSCQLRKPVQNDPTPNTNLSNSRITKIKVVLPDSFFAFPGHTFPIGVIAISKKEELKTPGLTNGSVSWNNYDVVVEGGTFANGNITLNADPRKTGSVIKISVTPVSFPGLKQTIELPVSYKAKFVAVCKGQKGVDGFNGLSGTELHQLDTSKQWHTYNGRKGQAGSDGQPGSDGCIADVFVKAITVDKKNLMSVLVINHCDNSHSVFWVDPDGGSLIVDVSGGNGGNGGNGGDGENGVNGVGADPLYTTVTPNIDRYNQKYYKYGVNYMDLSIDSTLNPTGNGGTGGVGGNGGRAGFGGNGGVAIVHLDSSAIQWKDKIFIDNSGGQPGKPGLGGYAGRGGNASYLMTSKQNGNSGYVGAEGVKAYRGQAGSATIWRVEKIEMEW